MAKGRRIGRAGCGADEDAAGCHGRLRSPVAEADYALLPPGAMPVTDDAQREAAYGRGPSTTGPADAPAEVLRASAGQHRHPGHPSCASAASTRVTMDRLHATRPGQKMVGFARTLRYVPFREDLFAQYGGTLRGGGLNAQKRAVEQVRPGEVLVIEARGEPDRGHGRRHTRAARPGTRRGRASSPTARSGTASRCTPWTCRSTTARRTRPCSAGGTYRGR